MKFLTDLNVPNFIGSIPRRETRQILSDFMFTVKDLTRTKVCTSPDEPGRARVELCNKSSIKVTCTLWRFEWIESGRSTSFVIWWFQHFQSSKQLITYQRDPWHFSSFVKLTLYIYRHLYIIFVLMVSSLPVRSYQTDVATRTISVTSRSSMLLSVIQLSKNSMVSCDGDSTCPLLNTE